MAPRLLSLVSLSTLSLLVVGCNRPGAADVAEPSIPSTAPAPGTAAATTPAVTTTRPTTTTTTTTTVTTPETTTAPTTVAPTTPTPVTSPPTAAPPATVAPTSLAPAPATTVACRRVTAPDANVRRGDCGPGVEQIQELLSGRWGASIAVDGDFGRATEAAVISFQREMGLVADGIVGEQTWIALSNDDIPVGEG